MNSRQRLLAIVNRKPVDRIPIDLWYTKEVFGELATRFGVHDELDLAQAMGLDKIVWLNPAYTGPLAPASQDGEMVNFWGVRSKEVRVGPAAYCEMLKNPPLTGYDTPGSLADYPWWPDPDQFDYDRLIARARKASANFVTLGPWVSFFEVYCMMRGQEQALMDLLVSPDLVNAILDRIEACQTEIMRRIYDRAGQWIDLAFLADDMGNQRNLMIAPKTWDYFFRPRMKRWCDFMHSYGLKVLYHSDGAAAELIPRLIEVGVDILNPIQHICPGMRMDELKRLYGDRLIFHGAVNTQSVLPFGTPAEVRSEARECLRQLGRGGGYICCSCHNVQAGTPVDNILALVETVHAEGNSVL